MSIPTSSPRSWAEPLSPPSGAMAPRWRDAAGALRRAAVEIPSLAHDLAAFDRADVWQGAVATRFADDLDRWGAWLGRPGAASGDPDLTGELLALADRLDARAASAEIAGQGDDAEWWGWRGRP